MKAIDIILHTWLFLLLGSCSFSDVEKKELVETQQKENDRRNQIEYTQIKTAVFESQAGWGYEIIIDDKIYIHQSYIPAISGTKSFSSKNDALKVAEYVATKIKKYHKLPSLTYNELDSLNVL